MAQFFIHNAAGQIDPWVVSQQAENMRDEPGGNKPIVFFNQQLEGSHQTALKD